jgi:hypothetical protein
MCHPVSAYPGKPEAMMSTAREHYTKAEQLLEDARKEQDNIRHGLILAEAQVHATLALGAPAETSPPRREQDPAQDLKPAAPGPSAFAP